MHALGFPLCVILVGLVVASGVAAQSAIPTLHPNCGNVFSVTLASSSTRIMREFPAEQFILSCFGFTVVPSDTSATCTPSGAKVTLTVQQGSNSEVIDVGALMRGSFYASQWNFAQSATFTFDAMYPSYSSCAATLYYTIYYEGYNPPGGVATFPYTTSLSPYVTFVGDVADVTMHTLSPNSMTAKDIRIVAVPNGVSSNCYSSSIIAKYNATQVSAVTILSATAFNWTWVPQTSATYLLCLWTSAANSWLPAALVSVYGGNPAYFKQATVSQTRTSVTIAVTFTGAFLNPAADRVTLPSSTVSSCDGGPPSASSASVLSLTGDAAGHVIATVRLQLQYYAQTYWVCYYCAANQTWFSVPDFDSLSREAIQNLPSAPITTVAPTTTRAPSTTLAPTTTLTAAPSTTKAPTTTDSNTTSTAASPTTTNGVAPTATPAPSPTSTAPPSSTAAPSTTTTTTAPPRSTTTVAPVTTTTTLPPPTTTTTEVPSTTAVPPPVTTTPAPPLGVLNCSTSPYVAGNTLITTDRVVAVSVAGTGTPPGFASAVAAVLCLDPSEVLIVGVNSGDDSTSVVFVKIQCDATPNCNAAERQAALVTAVASSEIASAKQAQQQTFSGIAIIATAPPSPALDSTHIGLIVGVCVGVAAVSALVIVAIVVARRRSARRKALDDAVAAMEVVQVKPHGNAAAVGRSKAYSMEREASDIIGGSPPRPIQPSINHDDIKAVDVRDDDDVASVASSVATLASLPANLLREEEAFDAAEQGGRRAPFASESCDGRRDAS